VLAWSLRLAHVLNGWEFSGAALAVVLAARGYVASRHAAGPEIPVEWWGVRRPWRRQDEEVLARGIAGG
jgi:branched-chain amino acid transport system permease protein